tara:strand:+ start:1246 stop:1686 length:441 start_codon:yes stop_codon:yes gene_type:complete
MKILISHRGNVNGKQPEKENTVAYIEEALNKGYHCEIDICKYDGEKFYLGHDEPQESVSITWLKGKQLWCHAKSYNALEAMVTNGIHCFFHHNDKYTMTSRGWIWAYPGQPVGANTIAVHPERLTAEQLSACSGYCSDNIENFKEE